MRMLEKMIMVATTAHQGQFDKGGKPYIFHPLKVMYKLKTDDEELMCIALGHDLLEDTKLTALDLIELGFTKRVVDGIIALTKIKGMSYDDYKKQVKSNKDAILVKMQDLRHNTDLRRLKGVTEKDIARVAKYMAFYKELEELETK